MGSEGKMKNLDQNYENEGGAVKVTTKPVEGGIKDPKSISNNTITREQHKKDQSKKSKNTK